MCRSCSSSSSGALPPLALLLVPIIVLAFVPSAYAFGAGSIPDYSYLKDNAFRHGDIESVIEGLSKVASGGGHSGLLGVAGGLAGALFGGNNGGNVNVGELALKAGKAAITGGATFSSLDVKRIYLGNFLRDYSQACDIAGLTHLKVDSIVLVVTVLSFMVFGYASDEFEITKEKLGVYLPVEHIDNPKGYAADQPNGDARPFDDRLRGPVLDEELEIDPNNGMKKYIATRSDRFDNSAECMRRSFTKCIELGRRTRDQPDSLDRYEAYRLLGTALHTSEDLMAHSNWMEIALQKLGYRDVFTHVGDNVKVRAPNGEEVPPLVTGTFGSADFIYSLLGEAGDKLSSATVSDVMSKMDDAKNNQNDGQQPVDIIKNVLGKANQGGDSQAQQKIQNVEEVRAKAVDLNPDQIASEELQKTLWQVLSLRDDIMKSIEGVMDSIPGLNELMEQLTNAITVYILTTIEPFVKPVMTSAIEGLQTGSAAVIDRQDQWEVFNDANASDPTHSVISKDHFDLILNEPGGQLAQLIVKHIVPLIVNAWYNDEDPNRVIDQALEVIHHPYFAREDSQIQRQLMDHLRSWIEGKPSNEKDEIIQSLTKESIREGRNKRKGAESYGEPGHSHGSGGGAYTVGGVSQWNRPSGNRPSGAQHQQHSLGGGNQQSSYGSGNQQSSYGSGNQQSSYGSGNQNQQSSYGGGNQHSSYGSGGGQQSSYGSGNQPSSYGGRKQYGSGRNDGEDRTEGYSSTQSGGYGGRRQDQDAYGSGRNDNDNNNRRQGQDSYGSHRQDDNSSYGGRRQDEDNSYGSRRQDDDNSYGNRRQDNDNSYGGSSYGRQSEQTGYGGARRNDDDNESYGRKNNQGGYGGSSGYGSQQSYGQSDNQSSRRDDNDSYGSSNQYGSQRTEGYGEERRTGGGGGYGSRRDDDEDVSNRLNRLNVDDDDRRGNRNDRDEYGQPQGRQQGGGYGGERREGYGGGGYEQDY